MGMRKYAVSDIVAIASAGTPDTCVMVLGSATHTVGIYDILFGQVTTPADQQMQWDVFHTTTTGTGDALTPVALNADIIAAVATASGNHSAEPTTAGIALLHVGLHQRSTFRWVARPGSELINLSAVAGGINAQCDVTSGTPTGACTVMFDE